MAYFAEINESGTVVQVVAVSNEVLAMPDGTENEQAGKDLLRGHGSGEWLKTSFNGTIRKNFAGIGYTYDRELDAFISPQPFPSWSLNPSTCQWVAPVPAPASPCQWDEDHGMWILL
ncbi:hypothetical protein UFOVP672_3 [uncultured Caudovirales phage]|uniref:Uncharacterized protein n=1 Tax=uncultured Caudovirales phage TaxID=2100421 RepID=A0A6J5N9F1_9CAUD|nr:hypothetical protein UFOVP672_3 [uncultured Caudovirales phage]